jgi:V/A-type H+/Na+-transporting ATPase subunit I
MVPFGFAVVGTGLNFGILFTSGAPTPVFDDLLGIRVPISVTATITLPVIAATLVFLVLGHPVGEYAATHRFKPALRAFGAGLIDAVAKPFEFFVNTLSYVRLGVLLVTTTLLGSLVAGAISYGAVGVLIAAFLNVAVISLEGVIVYIQDMRLQLYEWLSQFFVGGGTPFVPLISSGVHFSINWN